MQYIGGKALASRYIAPLLNTDRKSDQLLWDPFCGGLSVAVRAGGPVLCSDACLPLVSLYKAVADGWDPPQSVTKEEWEAAKLLPDTDPLKAFCGFGCSWLGNWFWSYARDEKRPDAYARRARNALLRDVPQLVERGGSFEHCDFFDVEPYAAEFVLYCDPPYARATRSSRHGTSSATDRKDKASFDHQKFWKRCQEWANFGVPVFVSESECPLENALCVWTKYTPTSGGGHKGKSNKQLECLFFVPEEE